MPISRTRYNFSENEIEKIVDFLHYKLTSRELAKELGVSHQQVFNMISKWLRDGLADNKIELKLIK